MSINKRLLGVFEISLYMREGVERFPVSTKAFWQSFYIVAFNFALIPISSPHLYIADPGLQNLSLTAFVLIFMLKFIVTTLILLTFVYYFCKFIKRQQYFTKYVIVANWTSLTSALLFIPFIIIMKMGTFTFADLAPYLIVTSIYIYSLGAFVAKFALKIPWELAVFLAICGMIVNETLFDILYFIADRF